MTNGAHRTATQWLLLCALFLGVVGMHHVTMSSDMAPPHAAMSMTADHPSPSNDPGPAPAHDLLHLCMAVLYAIGSLLVLAWLLLRSARPAVDRARATSAWPPTPDHPPPIGGRTLLSAVCVLRL